MLRADLKSEITLFKLITKEELVGKVEDISEAGHYLISKPHILVFIPSKGSLQLVPFQFGAPLADCLVYGHNLLVEPVKAPANLAEAYTEATREIVLDTSAISGINLRG